MDKTLLHRLRPARGQDEFRRDVQAGDRARDARQWVKAAQHYEAALQARPDAAGIWVQLGHSHKEAGNAVGAEAAYLQAKQLTPDDVDVRVQLGHFYKLRGNEARTLEHYRAAQELGTQDSHVLEYLARSAGGAVRGTPGQAGSLPLFGFTVDSALVPRRQEGGVVLQAAVTLDAIDADEFLYLAENQGLRFGCRVFEAHSGTAAAADAVAEASKREDSPSALRLVFALDPALLAGGPRLALLNPFYEGRFWFNDQGYPGVYAALGLRESHKADLFSYYFETFNADRQGRRAQH